MDNPAPAPTGSLPAEPPHRLQLRAALRRARWIYYFRWIPPIGRIRPIIRLPSPGADRWCCIKCERLPKPATIVVVRPDHPRLPLMFGLCADHERLAR